MHLPSVLIATLSLVGLSAQAATVTACVVADDHYAVFVGDVSGSTMTLVGSSGADLWYSQGAPFNFAAAPGAYLYVAAWDSASFGPPHMWIGEFTGGTTAVYSNKADWVAKFDALIKDPNTAQVSALAQSASPWLAPLASMPNGSSPYGSLIGGSPAQMIWHDAFDGTSASEGGYALFRSLAPVVAVPEPATVALLLAGLSVTVAAARRRG